VALLKPVDSPVQAVVEIPGSKSITNRALLLAGLAGGESVLRKPLFSDDTEVMITALEALGAWIEITDDLDLRVRGVDGRLREPSNVLHIGNSGTSVRFLSAAAVHLPKGASCILDGVERMRQRPIQDLIDAIAPLGGEIEPLAGTGCPPVRVHGGGLRGGSTSIRGSISSQFLSALMMSAPLASGDVAIGISGELVSKPYVDMTATVMKSFGADSRTSDGHSIAIQATRGYLAADYEIEPDASNASYFLAAAAVTGGRVTVKRLGAGSIQGDIGFAHVLEQAGCKANFGSDGITVEGPGVLQSVDVDMTSMPDMAQTLAVVCLFADGPSTIRGLHNLKVKETDRIQAIASELRKLGAEVEAGADYWTIIPPTKPVARAPIQTYLDHRMAMSFAVAGLRVDGGIEIDDPSCVAKTFPDFWGNWNSAFYRSDGAKGDG
jgi:3-phosphoshikimate 1-carboxyvinyltransferase